MSDFLYTLLAVFLIIGISFLLISFKSLIKGEEFKKTCSTTGEKCSCSDEKSASVECENRIISK
ncbi:MAG: hypothetical protein ACM3PT_07125 [Deltaproteobacteria bacterium]